MICEKRGEGCSCSSALLGKHRCKGLLTSCMISNSEIAELMSVKSKHGGGDYPSGGMGGGGGGWGPLAVAVPPLILSSSIHKSI